MHFCNSKLAFQNHSTFLHSLTQIRSFHFHSKAFGPRTFISFGFSHSTSNSNFVPFEPKVNEWNKWKGKIGNQARGCGARLSPPTDLTPFSQTRRLCCQPSGCLLFVDSEFIFTHPKCPFPSPQFALSLPIAHQIPQIHSFTLPFTPSPHPQNPNFSICVNLHPSSFYVLSICSKSIFPILPIIFPNFLKSFSLMGMLMMI